jgi:[ribosomal protein S18]-alanine N-acetyltransferase
MPNVANVDKRGVALNTFDITPYERRHRQAVLDLLFRSSRVHNHLDWHDTSEWLDMRGIVLRLGWHDGQLMGLMGSSTPLSEACWLRLIAVRDPIPARSLLAVLWEALRAELRTIPVTMAAVLITEDWLADYVEELGFRYAQDIITLRRTGTQLPEARPSPVSVRPANKDDLQCLAVIDQAAFSPPWQLSLDELRQARKVVVNFTVAQDEGRPVGYQLSTLHRQNGHLARLAVSPQVQGKGVGAALLDDLIRRFLGRGVRMITVNTQSSNQRARQLYARYGFHRTGYDIPVWLAIP